MEIWLSRRHYVAVGRRQGGAGPLRQRRGRRRAEGGHRLEVRAWEHDHIVCAPVGSFLPNSFGFFDMHGNVPEYCRDSHYLYGAERAGDGLNVQPAASDRVDRSGSFGDAAVYVRSTCRSSSKPTFRDSSMGLRAARSLAP